ncbi:LytR/AlgR family response regulator transcription factor [Spongiimicrobium salis]|uniref:LytR/AlgR family response regulator transcription factor n=1 Tax=Spongiimicrobium salis TaxID=1667022 RepID=UPI00374DD676
MLFFLIVIMTLSIVFETFQQQYYLIRFDLAPEVRFFELLKNQSYRWVIWAFLATPLVVYTWKRKETIHLGKTIFQYGVLIVFLVILNILLISGISWYLSGTPFHGPSFFEDYMIFFAFQKAPLFILGYIAISCILFLYRENKALSVSIERLGDLKKINKQLYAKLREESHDQEKILTIKIGNRYKAVTINDIQYIEADDYCVKIICSGDKAYVMRISLKALEQKLPDHFIRVHRKHIVNAQLVAEFNVKERVLKLKNGKALSVSKNKMSALRTFYSKTPVDLAP